MSRQRGDGDGGVQAARDRLEASERYEHRKTDRRLRQLIAERELERALTGSAEEYIVFERWKKAGGKLFEKHDEMRALEQRASQTPGDGGYFVPPLWLENAWSHSPRAGAPMAALWTQLPLPLHQGDTINVPVLAAGAGAGTTTQAGDGAPAGFRDPLDGTVQAKVETLAATLDATHGTDGHEPRARSTRASGRTSARTSRPRPTASSCSATAPTARSAA